MVLVPSQRSKMNGSKNNVKKESRHQRDYLFFVAGLVVLSMLQMYVWTTILDPNWEKLHENIDFPPDASIISKARTNKDEMGGANGIMGSLNKGNNRTNKAGPAATIGYAISFTSCSSSTSGPFLMDAAAVLKQSIHVNSARHNSSRSKYDYEMIAFIHPDAKDCFFDDDASAKKSILETHLGYRVFIRDTPVNVTEISSDFLRETVVKRGCCGEKEFIKLYAYDFDPNEFPIVVHLDLDTLILHPLDEVFDAMLVKPYDGIESSSVRANLPIMYPGKQQIPTSIDAMFTRDYGMIQPGKKQVPVQGGFLVVKPDRKVLEEYKSTILENDFRRGSGWGGSGYGGFYGAQQIQGLVPYFYDILHPQTAVELNPCVYNNMAQSLHGHPNNPQDRDKCRTSEETCRDCFQQDPTTVKTFHFTVCPKPWLCRTPSLSTDAGPMCQYMTRQWYQRKREVDSDRTVVKTSVCKPRKKDNLHSGCCRQGGANGFKVLDFAVSQ
jgi:hypothetical protein